MVALDNDIILKSVCYDLVEEVLGAVVEPGSDVLVLGAARYVVRGKLRKLGLGDSLASAEATFAKFLSSATELELDDQERKLAAQLEFLAQKEGLPLDGGESQLAAAATLRTLKALVTGDKRAIKSLESLLGLEPQLAGLSSKIICLEQIVVRILSKHDPTHVRQRICARAQADKSLAIVFSCSAAVWGPDGARQGLESYIANLRALAPRLLSV